MSQKTAPATESFALAPMLAADDSIRIKVWVAGKAAFTAALLGPQTYVVSEVREGAQAFVKVASARLIAVAESTQREFIGAAQNVKNVVVSAKAAIKNEGEKALTGTKNVLNTISVEVVSKVSATTAAVQVATLTLESNASAGYRATRTDLREGGAKFVQARDNLLGAIDVGLANAVTKLADTAFMHNAMMIYIEGEHTSGLTNLRVKFGLDVSILSGDMIDTQRKSGFDPKRPTVFVNGVNTTDEYAKREGKKLALKYNLSAVTVIENNTHMFVIGDALQILGHELGAVDITAIRARDAMRESIQKFDIVYVEAHSQGSAIAHAAFSLLKPEERARVIYAGKGPEMYIDKKGLMSATSTRYPTDKIAMVNDVLKWFGMRPFHQDWIDLELDGKQDFLGHNYIDHYTDGKPQTKNR